VNDSCASGSVWKHRGLILLSRNRKKAKRQAELLFRLVDAGVREPEAPIIGAVCFDQKRLSHRFFGPPLLSESVSLATVESWLAEHEKPDSGYGRVSDGEITRLIALLFTNPG